MHEVPTRGRSQQAVAVLYATRRWHHQAPTGRRFTLTCPHQLTNSEPVCVNADFSWFRMLQTGATPDLPHVAIQRGSSPRPKEAHARTSATFCSCLCSTQLRGRILSELKQEEGTFKPDCKGSDPVFRKRTFVGVLVVAVMGSLFHAPAVASVQPVTRTPAMAFASHFPTDRRPLCWPHPAWLPVAVG